MTPKGANSEPNTRLPPDTHLPAAVAQLPTAVERRIAIARALLFWQALWPALWPPLGLAGLFAAAALFGLIERLPLWLHGLLLIALALAIARVSWRGLSLMRWPSREAGLRWLETASGLPHHPLATYEDRLAPGTGETSLWQAHKRRAASALTRLRLGLPLSRISTRDPYVARAGLLIILLAALIGTPAGRLDRMTAALWPDGILGSPTGEFDAWITPPAYTARPPLFLDPATLAASRTDAASPPVLSIPTGSVLALRLRGGGIPSLTARGTNVTPPDAFARTGSSFNLDYTLSTDTDLTLGQSGRTLAQWSIDILPDEPPTIAFTQPIELSRTQALHLRYKLADDYGVTQAQARLEIDQAALGSTQQTAPIIAGETESLRAPLIPATFDLPLPQLRPRQAIEDTYKDLTPHPWAGLPVTLQLIAHDDAGQEGASALEHLVLPERPFTKPLARAVIEQRRRLARDPAAIDSVARFLDALTLDADTFIEDPIVYLTLRAAYWRLAGAAHDSDLAGIFDLLWDVALRIEDGDISLTERDLRAARDALMDALADNASGEEIERLMAELQQALDRYLNALSQQTDNQQPDPNTPDLPGDRQTLERQDLEDMLKAIGELARTGARDQARELLSQLQTILENMNTGNAQADLTPGEAALSQALDQMSELIGQQRALMDETFQQGPAAGQQSPPPSHGEQGAGSASPSSDTLEKLQQRQRALRDRLGDIVKQLGEQGADVPSALNRAERAMEDAGRRIENQRTGQAAASQGQAIDEMRQGAQAMADKLLESMADRPGQGRNGQGKGNARTDPLGRPMRQSGIDSGDNVTVPDVMDLQRAREILQELRRRAAELGRPKIELDYLERLLKRF